MNYILLTNLSEQFETELNNSSVVYYDLETTGLDCFTDTIRLAIYKLEKNTYIVNVETHFQLFEDITHLIKDKKIVGHNLKFDIKFTWVSTCVLFQNIYCTQTAESLLTAGIGKKFPSLASLVTRYCGVVLDKEIRIQFTEQKEITEEMLLYAAKDVAYLPEIVELQEGECNNLKMGKVFQLEMLLLPVVAKMELDGILLDWDKWMKLHQSNVAKVQESKELLLNELAERVEERFPANALEVFDLLKIPAKTKKKRTFLEGITDTFFVKQQLKEEFNLSSHVQMKEAMKLFGYELESTSKDELLLVETPNEFINSFLQYRMYTKRVSSFGENWKDYIHPVTGRIHSNYNQVGTATGRWSSDRPNLQNVPASAEFRECFISRDGYTLITADYSQAELRIMGAVSQERNIIDAYLSGSDIHTVTASLIFGVPLEEVTKEQRSRGKTLNFSILYGSSAFGIAHKNNDISQEEAEDLLNKFFAGYPQLSMFINVAGNMIWEQKFSKTPLGRIRFFEDKQFFYTAKERDKYMRQVKREGINLIIQGCSADSLKLAMVKAFYNNPFGDDFRFLLQVHDELVVEAKDEILDEAVEYLRKCMEDAEQMFLGEIPAVVEANTDKFWSK